jgi:hypothetical protein
LGLRCGNKITPICLLPLKLYFHFELVERLPLSLSKLFAANSGGRRPQPFEPELGIAMLSSGGNFL